MTTWTASELAGAQVRAIRQRRGLSLDSLAQHCAEIGIPHLTKTVLHSIESGRRHPETGKRRREISVDELLALALALDVPPVLLLTPPDGRDGLEITARVTAPAMLAMLWVTGEREPGALGDYLSWTAGALPVTLYRRFSDATAQVSRWLMSWDFKPPADKLAESPYPDLADVANTMIEAEIAPPRLPGMWIDAMRPWLKYPERLEVSDSEAAR